MRPIRPVNPLRPIGPIGPLGPGTLVCSTLVTVCSTFVIRLVMILRCTPSYEATKIMATITMAMYANSCFLLSFIDYLDITVLPTLPFGNAAKQSILGKGL
jgi:hypothetical protein